MEDKLREQLKQECSTLRKARKVSIIVACILLPIVISYMSWIYLRVKSLMQPEDIASMVRYQVNNQLPELKKNVTDSLKSSAPQAAEELGKMVLTNIPEVRIKLQEKLEYVIKNTIFGFENEFQKLLSEVLAPGSRELYVEIIDSLEDKETARQFTGELFAGVLDELDKSFKEEADLSLADVLEISSGTLETIHEKFKVLSSKEELTESEALQKEFIVVLMEFFRKSFITITK